MLAKFVKTILQAGTAIIGKVRLVDDTGKEVTEAGIVNVNIVPSEGEPSQVTLVDADGNPIIDEKGLLVTIQADETGEINPLPSAVTIGSTSTLVLAANSNRKYALFQNDSVETIYIQQGRVAALNTGIRLLPNGTGSYEMSGKYGNLYKGAIYGICSSGSKTLLVTEGV